LRTPASIAADHGRSIPIETPDARCAANPSALWAGHSKRRRKTATKQWEKVRALWNRGFRFFSYRLHPDAERLPEKLSEVQDFVRRNPNHPFRVVQ
jgi:hypothetical protein